MNSGDKVENKSIEQKHIAKMQYEENHSGGEHQQCFISLYENFPISVVIKTCRLEKGLSLRDVEKELHVRESYLLAIEENNLELMPERAYTLGFLRSYANFLGIDGVWAIQKYKKELESQEGAECEIVEDLVVSQSLISAQATKWIALTLFVLVVGIVWWTSQQSADPMLDAAPAFPQELFRQEQGYALPPASSPSLPESALPPSAAVSSLPLAAPTPSAVQSVAVSAPVSQRFSSPRSSLQRHAASQASSMPQALPQASQPVSSGSSGVAQVSASPRGSSMPQALPQASQPVSSGDASRSPVSQPLSPGDALLAAPLPSSTLNVTPE